MLFYVLIKNFSLLSACGFQSTIQMGNPLCLSSRRAYPDLSLYKRPLLRLINLFCTIQELGFFPPDFVFFPFAVPPRFWWVHHSRKEAISQLCELAYRRLDNSVISNTYLQYTHQKPVALLPSDFQSIIQMGNLLYLSSHIILLCQSLYKRPLHQ